MRRKREKGEEGQRREGNDMHMEEEKERKGGGRRKGEEGEGDRKSTRLNSSH